MRFVKILRLESAADSDNILIAFNVDEEIADNTFEYSVWWR